MSGVIVSDALVTIDFANEERAEGTKWQAAFVRAGQVHLRPVRFKSLVTLFALFQVAALPPEIGIFRRPIGTDSVSRPPARTSRYYFCSSYT